MLLANITWIFFFNLKYLRFAHTSGLVIRVLKISIADAMLTKQTVYAY